MGLLQKVLYKLAGTSEEVQKIYTEKGLCPEYVEAYTVEDNCTYPVSFNGKTRFTVDLPKSMSKDEVEAAIRAHELTPKYVGALNIAKVIVVPGRIVNIVLK